MTGKTAIIIGASRGIGLALARELAGHGDGARGCTRTRFAGRREQWRHHAGDGRYR